MAGAVPAWELTLLASLGGFCALVFAILAGWMSGAAGTDRLAAAPTRHLVTVILTLVGGALGLCVYLGLAVRSGGPGALAPQASKVFAGALMLAGGLTGLCVGRLIAAKAYY